MTHTSQPSWISHVSTGSWQTSSHKTQHLVSWVWHFALNHYTTWAFHCWGQELVRRPWANQTSSFLKVKKKSRTNAIRCTDFRVFESDECCYYAGALLNNQKMGSCIWGTLSLGPTLGDTQQPIVPLPKGKKNRLILELVPALPAAPTNNAGSEGIPWRGGGGRRNRCGSDSGHPSWTFSQNKTIPYCYGSYNIIWTTEECLRSNWAHRSFIMHKIKQKKNKFQLKIPKLIN